jgi:hypothetical protein
MPQRKSVRTVDASEVQGEGAYVKVSAVKVKEIKELRAARTKDSLDSFQGGLDLVSAHVLEWNFVDDEGEPLPQPAEKPEVVDELTEEEATFIVLALTNSEEQKN